MKRRRINYFVSCKLIHLSPRSIVDDISMKAIFSFLVIGSSDKKQYTRD